MGSPQSAPEIPVDPNLAPAQERAKNDQIKALQTQVQSDSASLMARYGTRLALAGTQAPAAPAPAAPTSPTVSQVQSLFGGALGTSAFTPFLSGALTQLGFKS